jgi:hypothetical protein
MPEDCPALVDGLMPYAMPALAVLLVDSAAELCADLVGVC